MFRNHFSLPFWEHQILPSENTRLRRLQLNPTDPSSSGRLEERVTWWFSPNLGSLSDHFAERILQFSWGNWQHPAAVGQIPIFGDKFTLSQGISAFFVVGPCKAHISIASYPQQIPECSTPQTKKRSTILPEVGCKASPTRSFTSLPSSHGDLSEDLMGI